MGNVEFKIGISIELSNPNGIYAAGQVVEGRLLVNNPNSIITKIKLLRITLWGEGRVKLIMTPDKKHSGKETYIDEKMTLVGPRDHLTIPPEETTTHPFRFQLPNNLPSSFSDKMGQVSYILKGEVEYGFDKSIIIYVDDCVQSIAVIGIYDLNLSPGASLPQLCMWHGRGNRGNVRVVFGVSHRSGFVPSEMMSFTATVSNDRDQESDVSLKVSLIRVATFFAATKWKRKSTEITSEHGQLQVYPGRIAVWKESLRIPEVPPTGLGRKCRIIGLDYVVRFQMMASGQFPVVGEMPIMIGTIPLRETGGNANASFQQVGEGETTGHDVGLPPEILPTPTPVPTEISPIPSAPPIEENPTEEWEAHPPSYEDALKLMPLLDEHPDLGLPSYAEAVGHGALNLDSDDVNENNQDSAAVLALSKIRNKITRLLAVLDHDERWPLCRSMDVTQCKH